MKVYQNIDGGVVHSHRPYDIDPTTKIQEGQVVCLEDGMVVPFKENSSDNVLGVAAEYHGGTPDALDPRSNGTEILVWDGPGQVFSCPAIRLKAAAGGTNKMHIGANGDEPYTGGHVKLVAKAANSKNTDAIGTVRRIKSSNGIDPGETELSLEGEGDVVISAGDEYVLFPRVGFAWLVLDEDGQKLVPFSGDIDFAAPMRVVGRIEETNEITVMATKHVFGTVAE